MSYYYCGSPGIYPCSAIAWIVAHYPEGQIRSGTGVVLGKNDVLTASHVIYDSAGGGVAEKIEVFPGADDGRRPYGSYEAENISYFEVDADGDGILSMEEIEQDFALLGFEEDLGRDTGWFFVEPYATAGLYSLTGYPEHDSESATPDMVTETGMVSEVYSKDVWEYNGIEVRPGFSGGPVWTSKDSGAFLAGIVSTESLGVDISSRYPVIEELVKDNDGLIPNSPPDCRDITGSAEPGEAVELDVLANDSDPDGEALDIVSVENPENGSVSVTPGGLVKYVPEQGFAGTENFSYRAEDLQGAKDEAGIVIEVNGEGLSGAAVNHYVEIQKLYMGFYGRPADPQGLEFWASKVHAEGGNCSMILDEFADSPEAVQRVFLDPDTGQESGSRELVENIYFDLFDREADSAGLEFYLEGLESGEAALHETVMRMIDAADGRDLEVMENRTEVGMHFTNRLSAGDDYRVDHVPYAMEALSEAGRSEESVSAGKEKAEMAVAVVGQQEEDLGLMGVAAGQETDGGMDPGGFAA